jgi:hypothetical protein
MSSPLALFPGRIEDKGIAHEFALVLDAQRTQMRRINALLDNEAVLTRQLSTLRTEYDNFRTQVRDLAIEKREEMNFCVPGLNEALEELGLEPMTRRFKVPVTITATQEVYVEVEATDAEAAREEVEEDWELAWDVRENGRYDWNHESQSVANTYSIEEMTD